MDSSWIVLRSSEDDMRYQLIPAAGLAATIALCGYFVAQLHAERAATQTPAPIELPTH